MQISNGYVCFYRGKRVEVHAETTLKAQEKARELLQRQFPRSKVKGHDIAVMLAEKGGTQVVHDTAILPGS